MRKIYGSSVHSHPDFEKEDRKFELLLASLVSSGDVIKTNQKYKIDPKALTTIETFERDERRHADSVRTNNYIAVLTAIIALATIVQIFK